MSATKSEFYCPKCNYKKAVFFPAKLECTQCGCRFKIDSNSRMSLIEIQNGERIELFQPNKIPFLTRVYYFFASLFLLIYGTFGLYNDDIYIPGKRSNGIHFHGYAAIVIYVVFLFAVSNMISVIIDHFDQRDNEISYSSFAQKTSIIAWTLFFIACIMHVFQAL